MATPGPSTYPGIGTYPGIPPVDPSPQPEGDVPGSFAAPLGLPPRECLLVKFTPPTGKGQPTVRECPDDLEFSSTAPGGHESMTCTIDWPVGRPSGESLATAATAQVIDRRTGSVIWHGHVVDPGDKRSMIGSAQQVACSGYYTVLDTSSASVAYIDRDQASWSSANDYPAGSTQIVDDLSLAQHPGDWVDASSSVIEMVFPKGSSLDASTPSHMTMQYLPAKYGSAEQDITLLLGSVKSRDSAAFDIRVRVRNKSGGTTQAPVFAFYDDLVTVFHWVVYQGFGVWTMADARVGELRLAYTGLTDATASKDWWLRWGNLAVGFQRLNRDGSLASSISPYVQAKHLVNDIIGRLLVSQLDISSSIAQPTALVEQAAWFGGITAAGVFDFVEDLAPDNYWAVWEPDLGTKARFEYVPWLTRPRYVIPPDSGILKLAGGADDLFNRAVVTYQTSNGVPASVIVSGTVRELSAAGVIRTMTVDLTGEGTLSRGSAIQKGTDALAAADLMRSAGTATVFGPVFDSRAGRMIDPWEIRAGYPVVMASGELRADGGLAFSTTGARDGRSTFRLTQARYSAATASMELTLDGGGRSLFNRRRKPVPDLRRAIKRRRRAAAGDAVKHRKA